MGRIRGLVATWPGRALLLAIVGVLVVGQQLVARATTPPPKADLRTASVTRATITQSVAVSGTVTAAASYKLSFKNTAGVTNTLAEMLVAIGDQVKKDQPLARIDPSDLRTALANAQTGLDIANAKYQQLVAGADANDVADAKRVFDKAQTAYATAKTTLQQNEVSLQQDMQSIAGKLVALRDQLVVVQYELSTVAQPIATTQPPNTTAPAINTPEPTANTSKADARTAVNSTNLAQSARDSAATSASDVLNVAYGDFVAAYTTLQGGIASFDAAVATGGDTAQANSFYQGAQAGYATATTKLASAIDTFAAYVSSVSSNVTAANNVLQNGGSKYEVNLNGARFELGKAQTLVNTLQQMLGNDKSKLTLMTTSVSTISDAVSGTVLSSRSTLNKVTATPKPTDLLQAISTLQSATQAFQNAQDNLAAATLKAPSDGTIATILNQVGENVTGTVITMANTTSLTMHGTIGEADVAKLRTGQVATINVDAVGATAASRMTGKVSSIDPVATIQSGVPVYGVDVQVDLPVPGVRAGMSGTANVIIATRQDVLAVPNLAVRSQGTRRFVQVLQNGEAVDATVTFGISNDTVTEITGGSLKEGDLVVLPAPRSATSARPVTGGFGAPGLGR